MRAPAGSMHPRLVPADSSVRAVPLLVAAWRAPAHRLRMAVHRVAAHQARVAVQRAAGDRARMAVHVPAVRPAQAAPVARLPPARAAAEPRARPAVRAAQAAPVARLPPARAAAEPRARPAARAARAAPVARLLPADATAEPRVRPAVLADRPRFRRSWFPGPGAIRATALSRTPCFGRTTTTWTSSSWAATFT